MIALNTKIRDDFKAWNENGVIGLNGQHSKSIGFISSLAHLDFLPKYYPGRDDPSRPSPSDAIARLLLMQFLVMSIINHKEGLPLPNSPTFSKTFFNGIESLRLIQSTFLAADSIKGVDDIGQARESIKQMTDGLESVINLHYPIIEPIIRRGRQR